MLTSNISDRNIAIEFLMFIFVKTYQDDFLYSFPRIVKIAYENGLLLRYVFLLSILLIYSLFPYLLVLSSYFLFHLAKEEFRSILDFEIFNLFQYILCILIFFWTRHLYPSTKNIAAASFSFLWVIWFSCFFLLFIREPNLWLFLIVLSSFSTIFLNYNNVFNLIHFNLILHCFTFISPKNTLIFMKMTEIVKNNDREMFKFYYFLIFAGIFIYYDTNYLIILVFYIVTSTILIFFLFYKHIKTAILDSIIIIIISNFFLFGIVVPIFFWSIDSYSLSVESLDVLKFSIIFLVTGIAVGIFLTLLYNFSQLIAYLFPEWWFAKKYRILWYQEDILIIFQAFVNEPTPKGREFILQFILTSPSPPDQKWEILAKMTEDEKKRNNTSQEVLDDIYKIRQEIRQSQRQKIGEEVSIAQNSLPNVTSFDFVDPTLENNRTTTFSPIDSARQQLLDWLKGETPVNPSIDKLLIYKLQDYEIGFGLKYSKQMGGDFYDLFQLPTANTDKQMGVFISDFGLLVGDLTGHGVETAVNLSKTHNFWKETDLNQDVVTTMRAFEQNFKTTFTPFPKYEGCELCYLQLKGNEITLSNSGLHLGLIKNKQWHCLADSPDENFGGFKKAPCNPVKRCTCVELQAGEMLVIYTDGLFGNANQDGERFGEERLQQLFLADQSTDLNTLIETVFETVYQHCLPEELEDDETLLVIRRISSTTDV